MDANNDIAVARRKKGVAAWRIVEEAGGPWPEVEVRGLTKFWQEDFWDGIGEYELSAITSVVKDCLPRISMVRSWPWIARATFRNESTRKIAAVMPELGESASDLIKSIRRQSQSLMENLMALDEMSLLPARSLSDQRQRLAQAARDAIDSRLGGATSVRSLLTGKVALQWRLLEVVKALDSLCIETIHPRTRGGADPWLGPLVLELAMFWSAATNRRPSTSTPCRKDGKPAPFVRLVDGCARLAGGNGATAKQVAAILKYVP
jgi:hypothetical protein